MTQFNPKSALLLTRIIYFALIFGVVFFLVISILLSKGSSHFSLGTGDPIFMVAMILTGSAITAGYYFSRRLLKFNSSDPLSIKWPIYQVSLIVKMAGCEGAALFSVVGLILSGNLAFILMILVCLAVMISYYPSAGKIGQELDLSQSEIDSLS